MSHGPWWPADLKPCGTPAAYRRHLRHGETPCRPCRDAHNHATKHTQRRQNQP